MVTLKGPSGFANTAGAAGSFQARGRSRVFTLDCEVGNPVPTLFLHNPSPTLKSFLREPCGSESFPMTPVVLLPRTLSVLFLGKSGPPSASPSWQPQRSPRRLASCLSSVLGREETTRRRLRFPRLSSAGLGGRRWKSSLHPREFHEAASHLWGYLQNFHLILNFRFLPRGLGGGRASTSCKGRPPRPFFSSWQPLALVASE